MADFGPIHDQNTLLRLPKETHLTKADTVQAGHKPVGAISEYPATYLHISQRFKKQGIYMYKQKDPFKFNEMQISGRVF